MRKDKSFYGKTNWAGALLAGALFISTGGIFFPLHAADTGDNLSVDQIQQQSEITVTGQVLDETGMGIPGANVSVKEKPRIGTITDMDGNFSLKVPENSVLMVSFVGYTSQEKKAVAGQTMSFNLVPDSKALDEVVVVGYGTQRRSTVTGAIADVKTDRLKDITAPSVSNMLQGKVAGVVVTPSSGRPGDGVSIRVRGTGSISGSQEPLWVIDGVIGEGSAELNPNDIESISILKDGSATALYGSRGANGVVQVTTKRAKLGTAQFNASAKWVCFPIDKRQPGNDERCRIL